MDGDLLPQLDFTKFNRKRVSVLEGVRKVYVLNLIHYNWSSTKIKFLGVFDSLDKAKLNFPKVDKSWKQCDNRRWEAWEGSNRQFIIDETEIDEDRNLNIL